MADLTDFTKPYYGLSKLSGVRKILVILWDPHRPEHSAPSKSDIDALIFGSTSSVRKWFAENSLGRFTIKKKALLGWYDAIYPGDFYWRLGPYSPPSDTSDPHYYVDADGNVRYLDDEGFYSGHTHSWAEAIGDMADPHFDFAPYDTDGDGVLENNELPIMIVKPQNSPFGTNRPVVGRQVPPQDLIVDGVKVPWMSEAYIGQPPNLGVVAHELCHQVFSGADMYPNSNLPPERRARSYSIMDITYSPFHLDPYHKLKLGWLKPRLIDRSGWYTLQDVETTGDALILHDPNYGSSEYFIVENRWPGTSFDQGLPGAGLAIWHIIEDPSLATDWGRRAVSLRRANGGAPVDDAMALFNGSSPALAYDLDDDSALQNLRFRNNRRSGIRIAAIPAAGKSMKFYVDVAPMWGTVQAAEGKITLLRVHDRGGYGPPDGRIDRECIVRMDSLPAIALGLGLKGGALGPSETGMLELLRSAYVADRRIRVEFARTGTITGEVIRALPL
jgi:immune inhibitor A